MRLTDILQSDCVKVPLEGTSKQLAVFELVDLLTSRTGVDARDELRQAVWSRETTRSTGIGHGVAIPHGKSASIKKLSMAIGKTAAPLDFNAIDGKPVELIILLASPVDQTGPHIQALARISRMLTDDKFRNAIKQATSSEAIFKMISDHEAADGA